MENPINFKDTVIWIIGQRSMLNDLLKLRIQNEIGQKCRMAPSFEALPWKQLNPAGLWITLIDTQHMGQDALENMLKACDYRLTCLKAMYNVHVADQLALEKKAFRLGWQGVFSISIGLGKMIGGITDVIEGRLWLQRDALPNNKKQCQSHGLAKTDCIALLTERERQVLSVIAKGATNEEISICLDIGLHTVKKHIYNIYQKIKVPNRLQAAIWGLENLSPS